MDSKGIRLFEKRDSKAVVKLFNNNSEWDKLTENLLHEKVFEDPSYEKELNLTAWEGKKLIGFLSGVTREIESEKTGYIKLMVVAADHRRKGVGRSFYEKLENAFRERGMNKIRVYDVPYNYFMPGIDPRYTPAVAFFETMGFRRFSDTANMKVNLNKANLDTDRALAELSGKGIEIARAAGEDKEQTMKFLEKYFPGWKYEVSRAFQSKPVSLFIAKSAGKVVSFSAYDCNNRGTGWFGPMGTSPDARGMGIGGILLKKCLEDIKESGLKEAIIPWVGPIRFYSYHVNAVVERVFWRYEKLL